MALLKPKVAHQSIPLGDAREERDESAGITGRFFRPKGSVGQQMGKVRESKIARRKGGALRLSRAADCR